jgi:hypothetical protein
MTRQEARLLAEQLCTRLMRMVGIERCTVPQLALLADEFMRVDSEAQAAVRLALWKGPDYELSIVLATTKGGEGWANLILDRRRHRRIIAMLPPPMVGVLKGYIPVKDADGVNG